MYPFKYYDLSGFRIARFVFLVASLLFSLLALHVGTRAGETTPGEWVLITLGFSVITAAVYAYFAWPPEVRPDTLNKTLNQKAPYEQALYDILGRTRELSAAQEFLFFKVYLDNLLKSPHHDHQRHLAYLTQSAATKTKLVLETMIEQRRRDLADRLRGAGTQRI